jgi:hypothetical protein
MTVKTALDRELATFEQHRKALLATAAGKWALIKGAEIIGTFDTQNDAVAEGYRRFGNVAFLVKAVQAVDTPAFFTSNLIAI